MILQINKNEYRLDERMTFNMWKQIMTYDFTIVETQRDIVGIAFDIPDFELELIPEKTLELGMLIIYDKLFPSKNSNYKIISFKDFTLGQFIDLEIFFTKSMVKNVDLIIEKLFNIDVKTIKYIDEVWWGINAYYNYRKNIFIKYKNLFETDQETTQLEEEVEKIDVEYLWWEVIMILANNEFLNIEKVVEQPLFSALNFLAWDRDKKQRELKMKNGSIL